MVLELQLQTLSRVSKILAIQSGQREMLYDIMDILEACLGFIRGTILLLTPDKKELTVEVVGANAVKVNTEIRYSLGEGIVGKVVSTGQSAIIPCVSKEPLFRDRIYRRREVSQDEFSFICVPIKIGNEVVGTLSVDIPYDKSRNLSEDERVLSIISSMIANDARARRMVYQERATLEAENLRLRDALGESFRPESIIGNSKSMRDVYMKIYQVSRADTTVLIRGESGTGKELIAAAIHFGSDRANNKIIKVNCAALSENILESELFGHERGAFTGAVSTRIGRLEEADSGTIFLDEIGEISPAIQVKLLRFLQEKEFERVGSNRTIKVNVRIVAATNRDLEMAVAKGLFRQDLYYRINVFPIYLPPLRERKEDILPIVNHFVDKVSAKVKKKVRRISTPAISLMMQYHWPGNIRELENCIEHAVLVTSDGVIHDHDLPPTLQIPTDKEIRESGTLKDRIEVLEKNMIIDTLKANHGCVAEAAKRLGITSRMVRYKIERLNIDYKKYFASAKKICE
ncbi:MAG TPA: sigma 54-interacting transcriptional regulator [Chitinispirillaceae bacterium]|nr:sigma 54-interacting transcriptional regulator [Chitinispirillaceae bacterium]